MSEDIMFIHYQKIAKAIINEIKNKVNGIIIGHGTDTLAITAAALSFMFENLPIPIIIVGSQRSSDRGSSDAFMNLICATEFITKTNFKGVAICMHESIDDENCLILPATKTRKMHTSRRDAFKVINDKPIARINYKTKKIEFINYHPKKVEGKLILKPKFEEKIGIIKTHPNMHKQVFEVFRKNKYKGFILEATGIGQAPTNIKENLPIYEELKKFIKSGGTIILTSQCIFGKVHEDIYTNCRRLRDIGIIFGEDMLTETAFVKLAWLLGNYKKDKVKELIKENLRGEINKRILPDEYIEE
jgi:glutamyl-tRNA(Gln) amidotransferase subunit D